MLKQTYFTTACNNTRPVQMTKTKKTIRSSPKEDYDNFSAACSKKITKTYSTSFYLGISYLGKPLRQPIHNIYGFVRLADEIVDSFNDYDRAILLEEFKADTFKAITRGISSNPVLNAFQQTVNEYNISHELINCFLHSMEMDLQPVNFSEQKEYQGYILGSAQVVGLMCLHVFTGGDLRAYEKLKYSAMQLGSAFQKVNFLRDLAWDYQQLDRSYFPRVNPGAFSQSEKSAIEAEIESELDQALIGIRLLPESSGLGVYLAFSYYKSLLEKIKSRPSAQLLTTRFRISNWKKLRLSLLARFQYSRGKI